MKILSKTVSVFALSLALAACGGPADETTTDTAAAEGDAMSAAVEGDAMSEAAPADAETVAEEAAPAAEAAPAVATPATAPAAPATPAAKPATPAAAPAAPKVAATPPPMFAVCAACHSVEKGKDGLGPSLAGVFGSKAGTGSFEFSSAMVGSGLTWDAATLDRYLENPRGVVPGTTMAYNGLKNEAQRKAIVEYLKGV